MSTYTELQAWLNGTVNGGPNADGRYPLTYADGLTYLVYCPAAQALNPAYAEQPVEIFASAAGTSAGEAAASAAEADQDRIDAQTAAANAAASASTANTHKNAAATSATNAATSATNAANSATAAGTSETNAAGSATAAAGSATTASGHASTANTAKTAAETARDRAQKWADEAVDVVVEAGKYSAKHWAQKAADSAASTSGSLATKVNKAGDTMTGALAFPGGMAVMGNSSGLGAGNHIINFGPNRWLTWDSGGDFFSFGGAPLAVGNNTVWHGGNLAQPLTQNTAQSVTATKTFTVEQTVDNCTFNFRNWAGVATNGLVKLGDSSYLWKVGSEFQLYNAQGGFTATISSGGTVLTTTNAANAQDTNNGGRLGRDAQIITDWNDAIYNGYYMAAGALNAPPGLSTNWGMGKVTRHNALWIQQEVFQFTGGAEGIRWRRHMNNGTWGSWTAKILSDAQAEFKSRIYINDGQDTNAPLNPGKTLGMYYSSSFYDGGCIFSYDYGSGYKPLKIEASAVQFYMNGSTLPVEVLPSGLNIGGSRLYFGESVRQMITLWGGLGQHGLGVQNSTSYERTSGGFAWFKGGTHSDAQNDPGAGGTVLATLDGSGNFTATTLRGSGSNGAHFSGNGAGTQHNGNFYQNGLAYDLSNNGAVWVQRRRIFVGTTVDINQMGEDDLFVEMP